MIFIAKARWSITPVISGAPEFSAVLAEDRVVGFQAVQDRQAAGRREADRQAQDQQAKAPDLEGLEGRKRNPSALRISSHRQRKLRTWALTQ
ncbi:MAG: hypothetical protein H6Q04_924 [Acidobacteria bacterium]|nr:hypothetical protein [Acidobacteriota bacterium]